MMFHISNFLFGYFYLFNYIIHKDIYVMLSLTLTVLKCDFHWTVTNRINLFCNFSLLFFGYLT